MQPELEEGAIAYDLAQLSPVIIVDEDIGSVAELDNPRQELVMNSPGNRAIGFDAETRVANVTYFDLQSENDSVYAFPYTRLGIPVVEIGQHEFTPRQYVIYQFLRDLLAEAKRDGPDMVGELQSLLDGIDAYDDVLEPLKDDISTE